MPKKLNVMYLYLVLFGSLMQPQFKFWLCADLYRHLILVQNG